MIKLLKRSGNTWRLVTALILLGLLLSAGAPTLATTTTAVDIVAFSFSPALVNTGLQPGNITFTIQLSTSSTLCSGNLLTQVNFLSPSALPRSAYFSPANLKPGTTDTYVGTMTLPVASEQGTWTLNNVAVLLAPLCTTNNAISFNVTYMTTRGFPTTFVVKNSSVLFLPAIFRPR